MEIKILELEKIVREALSTKYDLYEVELMLPVIMFGELAGVKSHGIMRICSTGESILSRSPKSKPKLIHKSKVSSIIESYNNSGMLIGAIACNEAIRLGKEMDIGIIGTHGSTSSSGSLSYYAEKLAKENLIGIIMARAPADVAPYGGTERLLGTNPMAFGIPASDKLLIFDMATSAISYGAVARAKRLNLSLPDNVAIDSKGDPTNDPHEALNGAFLTFGNSYKSYGLAIIVEVLAGILPGASFLDSFEGDGWGNLFIAINPNVMTDINEFKRKTNLLITRIKKSKSLPGYKVRIPGENKIAIRDKALKLGITNVDKETISEIKEYIASRKRS